MEEKSFRDRGMKLEKVERKRVEEGIGLAE